MHDRMYDQKTLSLTQVFTSVLRASQMIRNITQRSYVNAIQWPYAPVSLGHAYSTRTAAFLLN